MGASRLSARSTRRVARATGLPVLRGWSHGGYTLGFVTTDHQHGWFDKKTGQWGWHDDPRHYSSCHTLFHWAIPRGHLRLKMIVDPGLVTIQSLRHYREVLREQARAQGYVPEGGIHTRWSAIPYSRTPAVVLEVSIRERGTS